ncbi:hypothetical protein BLNAU_20962 [Blattamonas nauphoetae]|uniref:Uncharacterized protein n=1 Tax=Blattamonas nauphoetae TaxID=2049346 RepID=A0ABQ9WXC0_9EUKA|nr:hypothetical protein BLNAU_20962 [Blattamonas nauphoetae]
MGAGASKISSSTDCPSPDCSPFLNWQFNLKESESTKVVGFRSLVATVKIQPSLDISLEVKAVEFLKSVHPLNQQSTDAFLSRLASSSNKYLTDIIQPMMLLISSPSQAITTAAMKMLRTLIIFCSPKNRLALFKADLIPQLITTLHPQSLPFAETEDIHACLISNITSSLWLSTPNVFLTIPSCLTIIEYDGSLPPYLSFMRDSQREWNRKRGEPRQMGKIAQRMLRMEGFDDVIEEKLRNDRKTYGRLVVARSIEWNNLHGMNLPLLE